MFTGDKKDEYDANNVSTDSNKTPPDWSDVPIFDTDSEQDTPLTNIHEEDDPIIPSQNGVNDISSIGSIPLRYTTKKKFRSSLSAKSRYIMEFLLSEVGSYTKKTKVIIILAILIFGFTVFALISDDGTQPKSTKITFVMPADVIKEAPVDPKGMQIEYLDKVVYGAVNDVEMQQEKTVEKLLPKIEKPIIIESTQVDRASTTPEKVVIKPKKIVRQKTVKTKVAAKPTKTVRQKTVKTKVAAKPTKTVRQKTVKTKAKNSGKSWRVQLSAIRASASAEKEYAKYLKKYSVLKGKKLFIELVVIKGKTYQRLQAIGYKTKSLAKSTCKSIIAQGGKCLVKKP